jgi:hypothetical protein
VKISDNTNTIKPKIAATAGISIARQIVRHPGIILRNPKGKTVKDMGIYEGTTLEVDILKLSIHIRLPDERQSK